MPLLGAIAMILLVGAVMMLGLLSVLEGLTAIIAADRSPALDDERGGVPVDPEER